MLLCHEDVPVQLGSTNIGIYCSMHNSMDMGSNIEYATGRCERIGGESMPAVKTAISLDEDLFLQVCKMAENLCISRSRLFTLAISDYLRRQESEFLLKELNETYGDEPDREQTALSEAMHKKNRQMIEGEW